MEEARLWDVSVNSSPDQHQCPRWPPKKQHQPPPATPYWPGLAWPHLTSQAPRLQLLPQLTFPRPHLCARAVHASPTPRIAFGFFLSQAAERAFSAFPPSAATVVWEGRRGRGKEWEVGERARRSSVVVSWLRAAVVE